MKKLYFSILFLTIIFFQTWLYAQQARNLSKEYSIVSVPYTLPDKDQLNFQDIAYRFGWKKTTPYTIAVQFINSGYVDRTFKFAIKDLTADRMILLDAVHNSRFGTETIKPLSYGIIWSGPVDNIKDSFSLRIWNSNGDKFDQAPISIVDTWMQKSIPTPASIKNEKTASLVEKPVITATFTPNLVITSTQTPTITHTAIMMPTQTLTAIATATATPASTLIPTSTPSTKSIYLLLGDSWVAGTGASPNGVAMWGLTTNGLSIWYPQIQWEHMTLPGCGPDAWIDVLPNLMSGFAKKGIPVGYAIFIVGPKEFFVPNKQDCPDCCKGATPSQGTTYSYIFQKNLDKAVSEIYAADPDIHLVIATTADSSGGYGKITPEEVYLAYRQRIYELQAKYPQMRIADLYTSMFNHPEYFCPLGDPAYTHPNDLGQAIMSLTILEQFANWPYQPSKH